MIIACTVWVINRHANTLRTVSGAEHNIACVPPSNSELLIRCVPVVWRFNARFIVPEEPRVVIRHSKIDTIGDPKSNAPTSALDVDRQSHTNLSNFTVFTNCEQSNNPVVVLPDPVFFQFNEQSDMPQDDTEPEYP
jgi:hypothetical protein